MNRLHDTRPAHVITPFNHGEGIALVAPLQAPRDSWWLNADRVTFQRRVVAETPRMITSRFGRLIRIYDKGLWD